MHVGYASRRIDFQTFASHKLLIVSKRNKIEPNENALASRLPFHDPSTFNDGACFCFGSFFSLSLAVLFISLHATARNGKKKKKKKKKRKIRLEWAGVSPDLIGLTRSCAHLIRAFLPFQTRHHRRDDTPESVRCFPAGRTRRPSSRAKAK